MSRRSSQDGPHERVGQQSSILDQIRALTTAQAHIVTVHLSILRRDDTPRGERQ
jgi:hypothetical protein